MCFNDFKCLEFLMQVLNVGGIKFGELLISPTAKFSSTPIFPAIWYHDILFTIMTLMLVCHNHNNNSSFKDTLKRQHKLLMFSSIMFPKGME